MSLYKGMDAETLEAQYNLLARLGPDYPALVERFMSRSATQREASGARVDLAYGDGTRDRLDFFSGGDADGPIVVYIHGSYRQRGDKSMYSFSLS